MSNHTPGPWQVIDGHYPGFLKIIGASFEPSIVTCATDLDFKDFCARTADAHLMASAPELLEALETLKDAFIIAVGDKSPYAKSALELPLAAIAKARGES